MAVGLPQLDNPYLGGSDIWDDGLVGEILLQDYFEAPTPVGGYGKIKQSGSFVDVPDRKFKASGSFASAVGYKVKISGTFVDVL